jgi:inosine-uridine nucleoside N-ribohydrolase
MLKLVFAALLLLGACSSPDHVPVSGPAPRQEAVRLWVDGDFACGPSAQFADPDDCLALVLAQRAAVPLVGISTTRGNGSATLAFTLAQELSAGVPVWRGDGACDSPLIQAFRQATLHEPVTVLAMGPLTNIASILRCDTTLKERISEIVFVGGRRVGQRLIANTQWWLQRELRDLNVEVDREAVAAVLESGVRLRLVPFEAGNAVPLQVWSPEFRNATSVSPVLNQRLREWSALTRFFWGTNGVLPFDPVALAATVWPEYFTCLPVAAQMVEGRLEVERIPGSFHIMYCLPREPNQVRTQILRVLLR